MIEAKNWESDFPFKKVRQQQESTINIAIDAINSGKKFIILDLGTGVGKSAIGITISRYFNRIKSWNSYFLTTQKILQDQYMNDFGGPKQQDLKCIKGAENYTCSSSTAALSCGYVRSIPGFEEEHPHCMHSCAYKVAKNVFLMSNFSLTNYSYFLKQTFHDVDVPKRNLLILDEGHNIDSEISNVIDIELNSNVLKNIGIDMPEFKSKSDIMPWIKEVAKPMINVHVKEIEAKLEKKENKKNATYLSDFSFWDKVNCKLKKFLQIYEPSNWVCNYIYNKDFGSIVNYKPIDISQYSKDLLFSLADHVIIMSATIVNFDNFTRSLGIDKNDCLYISEESPFPYENRPIFYFPIANMGYKTIDQDLPKSIEFLKEVLEEHNKDKGVIHCSSYKITNFIKENLKDKRLLIQDNKNKNEILEYHKTTKEPTVLVSPSMNEGVDLKDDLSRFQVLMKLPFPHLGDELVKARKEKWSWWYNFETIKTIVQSVGRSVRNEEDKAVTYIIDTNFEWFLKYNKKTFPQSFLKQMF